MAEGGRAQRETDRSIRLMTLLLTPVFIIHGLLVMVGVVPSANYVNPLVTIAILALWMVVGLYHFFAPFKSRGDILARFILFQSLALATILFITGFFQPFVISLVLLFVSAHLYFGYRGFTLSLLTVLIAAAVDTAIRFAGQPEILPLNMMASVAILVLAIITISVLATQETRRRALAKSQKLERLQYDRILTIINNMSDATFSTDSHGKVQLYNAACLNLLDTNASLKGKQISELFTLSTADNKEVQLYDLLKEASRTTRRDDLRHVYADGEQVRLEITFAPIKSTYGLLKKSRQESGYIVIARDVTKQKSLEEERDEFISVVSHELRTPITIVEGTLSNLQLLMEKDRQADEKVLQSTIKTAHDQVIYLAKMVNDLSTLSRAERGVADEPERGPAAVVAFLEMLMPLRLRALWALHVTSHLKDETLVSLLEDSSEHLRAWAIQLLAEDKNLSEAVRKKFVLMAKKDKSPLVRLYLASAMQRLTVKQRVPVLKGLLGHAEDADDQNLPLMYWYAAEAVVAADKVAAVQLLAACKIPKVRQFITRRMATGRDAGKKE